MQESESERLIRLFPMEKDDFEPGKLWPPQPKQFPAPLEEFYHLIIGGETCRSQYVLGLKTMFPSL